MEETAHHELVRLVALLDVYEHALDELEALDDPALEALVARLTRLQERVALDLYSEYDIAEIRAAREQSRTSTR